MEKNKFSKDKSVNRAKKAVEDWIGGQITHDDMIKELRNYHKFKRNVSEFRN